MPQTGFNYYAFFNALLLMLLSKFVLNSISGRCSSGIMFPNFDAKIALKFFADLSKIALNVMHNQHHCSKFMQIKCYKGSGTEMQKCLLGY